MELRNPIVFLFYAAATELEERSSMNRVLRDSKTADISIVLCLFRTRDDTLLCRDLTVVKELVNMDLTSYANKLHPRRVAL